MADTTITLDASTKDRLDGVAPPGASWDARLNALLDGVEHEDGGLTEGDVAELLAGQTDDLLAQLPERTARAVHERRP